MAEKNKMTAGQKQAMLEKSFHEAMEEAKKDTVKIRLPFLPNHEDEEVFVSVNGYRYQIQRGVDVEVPKFVAEALHNSERQKMEAHKRMQILQEKAEAGVKAQAL